MEREIERDGLVVVWEGNVEGRGWGRRLSHEKIHFALEVSRRRPVSRSEF